MASSQEAPHEMLLVLSPCLIGAQGSRVAHVVVDRVQSWRCWARVLRVLASVHIVRSVGGFRRVHDAIVGKRASALR